jgi:hypothetical protein
MDITDLIMTKYFITEKEKQVQRLNNEIEELQNKLIKSCTHPTTITTSEYTSGTYNDLSFVTITHKCSICDKILESYYDPKHKGHYG